MPEHIQYEDDELFNPETHHEESDVPVKPLWWALILFVVFAVITHIVLWFFYQGMVKSEQKRWDPPQTAVAIPENAGVPQNQPLLQPFPIVPATETTATVPVPYDNTPVTDLIAMRAAEDKILKHYGWVDKQRGLVHIPIQQAKELFAARVALQSQGVVATSTSSPADAALAPQPATSTSAAPATSATTTAAPAAITPNQAQTTTGGVH